jgi:ATP-binding cassette subfamily F protein 3
MLFLRDLSLAFGGRTLFENLSWTVRAGERIGLVGPNGAGKSTLLRVIAGDQGVDGGEVVREGGATTGFLRQDTQELDISISPLQDAMRAFEDVLALDAEAHRLLDEMETHADHDTPAYHALVDRFSRTQEMLATRDAHTVEARTAAILSGLGFTDDEMRRPLSTFSGGWRMRVALARLLLGQPDILLLDEPTNHLDIESIDWLEQYLTTYPGAVVLVSHDRYFLDRMTTRTSELIRGQIDDYAGNYSFYLEARVERRQHWQAQFDNQQKSIGEMERFVERFKAKASKAKQAQSRMKALEKLERIEAPPAASGSIRFRFPDPPPSGRVAVELSDFSKSYPAQEGGTTRVFEHAGALRLEKGDKVALVGKNGAGKSTLARILLGTEGFEGEREVDRRAEIAHFAQHQAEALDPSQTVFGALQDVARGQSDTALRSLLGAFLFQGDDVFKPVSVLSGGERSRLALARTLLSPANVLVLDEPTNHLDITSKDVLAEALRQYTGAFVLVSHDRHFIDAVAESVWYVEDRAVKAYAGTYTEAQWQRENGTAARLGASAPASGDGAASKKMAVPTTGTEAPRVSGGKKTKEEKRREAEARNAAYQSAQGKAPAKTAAPAPNGAKAAPAGGLDARAAAKALQKVEAQIAAAEARKTAVEAEMADPDLYGRPAEFAATMARFNAVEEEVKALYARWEALAAQAEA